MGVGSTRTDAGVTDTPTGPENGPPFQEYFRDGVVWNGQRPVTCDFVRLGEEVSFEITGTEETMHRTRPLVVGSDQRWEDQLNMTQAYVLVQTESRNSGIAKDLEAVAGVIVAEDLSGPYDAIALARSDSSESPLEGIVAQLREVPGVTRTIVAPLLGSLTELRDGEAA